MFKTYLFWQLKLRLSYAYFLFTESDDEIDPKVGESSSIKEYNPNRMVETDHIGFQLSG